MFKSIPKTMQQKDITSEKRNMELPQHKDSKSATAPHRRLPSWFKIRIHHGDNFSNVGRLIGRLGLNTVCRSARCPNIWECWNQKTATFMILGNVCTRTCRFCAVKKGSPTEVDKKEPERVAEAVKALGLRHAVITSVTRDDIEDGGADIFADTISSIRKKNPACTIEVLIPDFNGSERGLKVVMEAAPHILGHNIETVPRLYSEIRPQGVYKRSLWLLKIVKDLGAVTKSGLMVGLGEDINEVIGVMSDLREVGCDMLTLGQYLMPDKRNAPVVRFYTPEEFAMLKQKGKDMGFKHIEAGPLVRSSYHADVTVRRRK